MKSETLCDFFKLHSEDTSIKVLRLTGIMSSTNHLRHPIEILYNYLHHSRTSVSTQIFILLLTYANRLLPTTLPNQSNNKNKYYKYKHDLSHLLMETQSEAVSGWLILASFFYVHKKYVTSLSVIYYALSKCTDIHPRHTSLNPNL